MAQMVKSAYNAEDLGLISGSGRSPGEGNGNSLQIFCMEIPMNGGAWQAKVHRVTKSQTWLSDFTFFSPKQTTIKLRQILSCDKAFSTFVKLYKESRVLKNWCFWTVVLKMTLESPLDCKEIQPVHPKEDHQSWVFTGRTEVEAETSILWPPDAKSWLIWKDPDAGQDWGQEEKGTTEDEMVGSHHQLDGHGFGWTLVVGDGQGGLVCWGSWGRKESDTTEQLNWTEK